MRFFGILTAIFLAVPSAFGATAVSQSAPVGGTTSGLSVTLTASYATVLCGTDVFTCGPNSVTLQFEVVPVSESFTGTATVTTSPSYGGVGSCGMTPLVTVGVSNLQPGTAYKWRVMETGQTRYRRCFFGCYCDVNPPVTYPWSVFNNGDVAFVTPPAPSITSFSPASGTTAGGTLLSIEGANFVSGAAVKLNGIAAATTFFGPSNITAVTPANAAGPATLTVTNPDNQVATASSPFTYVTPPAAPEIAAVSPASGPATGGTTVSVSGANFQAGAVVKFDSTAAATTFQTASSLSATTPPHAQGAVSVTVVNPDNQTATLPNAFTYMGAPQITSIVPNTGPPAGGTTVNIVGSNFVSGATVLFGTVPAPSVVLGGSTALTVTTPAQAAGAVSLTVTNPDGQTVTVAGAFTYVEPVAPSPVLTFVNPASGPSAGGTTVTIVGANFANGATVHFGSIAAPSVIFGGANTLTATTPAHAAGAVDVTVTNPDGQTITSPAAFTYVPPPAPVVTAVDPTSGPTAGGTTVRIAGANFVSGATVRFGSTPATSVAFETSNSLVATTPAHAAGAAGVTVTNPDAQSGTLPGAFTYVPPPAPVVTSVSPASGPTGGGTIVTIAGSNFVSGATVRFGSLPASAVTFDTANSLTATTPSQAAGAVSVTVTNPDGQTTTVPNAFTYVLPPAPVVTSLSPSTGPAAGGTTVRIAGANFVSGATVRFGSVAAATVFFEGANSLSATTPAQASGVVGVTVTNPDGQTATLPGAFTYIEPPSSPFVMFVDPSVGPLAGGTAVRVRGTDFRAGATVSFGGLPGISPRLDADFGGPYLSVITPAHAAGPVDVTVTNPDGQRSTKANGFLYSDPPTITSVAPPRGPTTGGTIVTITGSGFVPGLTVRIGGIPTEVKTVTTTTITVATSPAIAGPKNVQVTNPSGQSALLAGGFLYHEPILSVTNITPNHAPASGGTFVTITGTNFRAGIAVVFGGVAAPVTLDSSTQMTVTVPPHEPGAVDLTVKNADGFGFIFRNAFRYLGAPPAAESVSPARGPQGGGTMITVRGSNFQHGLVVLIGTVRVELGEIVSPAQLNLVAPPQAAPGTYDITITNPDGQTIVLPNAFTYYAQVDLQVGVTSPEGPVDPGVETIIGVTVRNSGPSPATGVKVRVSIPPSFRLTFMPPNCSGSPVVTCEIGDMKPDPGLFRGLVMQVIPQEPGVTQRLSATITGDVEEAFAKDNDVETTYIVSCISRDPVLRSPDQNSTNGPAVTLRWRPVVGATQYSVYASSTGTPRKIGTTREDSLATTMVPGQVEWYVEAEFANCSPQRSDPGYFIVEGAPRKRSARR